MNLTDAVKAAGVVGAGGAGFPTHVKLGAEADCLIINAAECEPLIETDKYLCRTFADRIVKAAELMQKQLKAGRVVIALKESYLAEIESLQKAIGEGHSGIELFFLRAFYPAGDEQILVHQVLQKSVPERGLPLDVGAVVENVGTVLNILDAWEEKPVVDKYLSVTGQIESPVMLKAPLGTPIRECLKAADVKEGYGGVIVGGPMMGKVLTDPDVIEKTVVTKTTGNLLVIPPGHTLIRRAALPIARIRQQAKSACIQCRLCTDLCPRYLIGHQIRPHLMMRNLWREEQIQDPDSYLQAFGDAANCCSCGVCEMFACPMGLSPRKVNEYLKQHLRKRQIQVPKNGQPQAREGEVHRKVSTGRLTARLDLTRYTGRKVSDLREVVPDIVQVPLSQHIGKPAVCIVKTGQHVERGEQIGEAQEGLSAAVHASLEGDVSAVTDSYVQITGREG